MPNCDVFYVCACVLCTLFVLCIQWLKRLRHPCVVKFHEVALFSEEICVVTERVTPLQLVIDSLAPIEICSGLYNIIEALSFLHQVVSYFVFS